MAGPLLETKLHVPRPRRGLVARPGLTEHLNRAGQAALTLVSAPAGFGKSTVLTEWLAGAPADGRSVAWLSLDQRDNDPAVFWTYLVAAVQKAEPGVGAAAHSLLRSSRAPMDAVLATLLNDLHAVAHDVVLVLDDYHVIEAPDVQDGMAFLLDHLPPQIHLVIAGRADPALPLARMRGRGQLVEIRAADLRFTPDEATAYLNDVMGLALAASEVAALEGRTEGWIAALQLAALSMQGRDDAAGFIAGFAGDDRYIVDYLVEEVLQRQPEHVRSFLLQTSVLGRLNGSLCDAVTGRDGGRSMLEALERGNLFLVPLDDRRRWYRYHHLFADVLRTHLLDEQPDVVPGLHRRASAWHSGNGEPAEAIGHLLDAGDVERAADLIELAAPAMRRTRQEATIRSWLEALPDDLVRSRPVLSVEFAGVLLALGEVDGVEARLLDAERSLDPPAGVPGAPQVATANAAVVDGEELVRLRAMFELYRAGRALADGDGRSAEKHARRALEAAAEEDHLCRASASGLLGLAAWGRGDLEEGHRSYAACMAGLYRAGFVADTHGCAIALADIRRTQGRLGEAMRTYEQALQRAHHKDGPVLRGTADMYVGMSEICRERDDLPAAARHLGRSSALGEHTGLPQNPYRSRVAMARLREAEGDLSGALDLIDEADRLYVADFFPDVRPVAAVRARLHVAQGRWADAVSWARERAVSVEDDLSYLREFEHITLVRVLLARHRAERADRRLDEATLLAERLLRAAEDGGRTGSVIEILVLLALAHQARGDLPAALAALRRSLDLAEPEGYVRIFLDEGPSMVGLLRAAEDQRIAGPYVRRLLATRHEAEDRTPAPPGVVDPLSPRELDVLRLLGSDLDGPDIARELFLSLNTVRTHTKNIYAKLGVTNRRAAVRRAGELGLTPVARDGLPRRAALHDR